MVNKESRTLYEDPDIIALVNSKRLMWLDHGQRRGERQINKRERVWTERPDETRPLGRPKMRWKEPVLGDLISN